MIRFHTRVISIQEHSHSKWVSGAGSNAVFETVSLGWFLLLEGSYEAIYAGGVRPNLNIGDPIVVDIYRDEKAPSA